MTTETKTTTVNTPLTDRIELDLNDFLTLESVLWERVRTEPDLEKVRYQHLHLLGRLHKCSRRLKDRINETARK